MKLLTVLVFISSLFASSIALNDSELQAAIKAHAVRSHVQRKRLMVRVKSTKTPQKPTKAPKKKKGKKSTKLPKGKKSKAPKKKKGKKSTKVPKGKKSTKEPKKKKGKKSTKVPKGKKSTKEPKKAILGAANVTSEGQSLVAARLILPSVAVASLIAAYFL